jgi:hypothetical protein
VNKISGVTDSLRGVSLREPEASAILMYESKKFHLLNSYSLRLERVSKAGRSPINSYFYSTTPLIEHQIDLNLLT